MLAASQRISTAADYHAHACIPAGFLIVAITATRFAGLPDVHYGEDEHFVDEDAQTGISKWTLTGIARDGTRMEVRGCDFYSFRDGKVIRKDSYWKIVEAPPT